LRAGVPPIVRRQESASLRKNNLSVIGKKISKFRVMTSADFELASSGTASRAGSTEWKLWLYARAMPSDIYRTPSHIRDRLDISNRLYVSLQIIARRKAIKHLPRGVLVI
jgi:hypothetical protein